MIKFSKVQSRGRVTIPVEIRRKLGLKKGDLVAFVETEDGILIVPREAVVRESVAPHEACARTKPEREAFSATVREIQAANEGADPEQVMRDVVAAQRAVRSGNDSSS